ncbi:hypothetical protein GCM10017790_82230 [Amycolatopsis oliviviridis]|uniref:Uncharacterized protein n=1 Tax=Amycolatopsis oliviviridis TaxID=1471590 RepID=A0ABQ3MA97_9PSEU|nr:hypothetical protein GCM10017790_82230 [Amycolatopsis oliviviridis]
MNSPDGSITGVLLKVTSGPSGSASASAVPGAESPTRTAMAIPARALISIRRRFGGLAAVPASRLLTVVIMFPP